MVEEQKPGLSESKKAPPRIADLMEQQSRQKGLETQIRRMKLDFENILESCKQVQTINEKDLVTGARLKDTFAELQMEVQVKTDARLSIV